MAKKGKEKVMLNVKEAAARLNVPLVSVRLWARSGRFEGAKLEETPLGSYWLIPEDSIKDFKKDKPGPKPGAKKEESEKKTATAKSKQARNN
jgi:hypothetical protein